MLERNIITLCLLLCASYVSSQYFFNNGTQRCNCYNNVQCDNDTGVCPDGYCSAEYMGVRCQHRRLTINDSIPGSQFMADPLVADGNDSTCQPPNGSSVSTVSAIHAVPKHFVKLYISWKSKDLKVPDLKFSLDSKEFKPTLTVVYFDPPGAVVYRSKKPFRYTKLEVANLPAETCSVDISLGRSILHQAHPASQMYTSKRFRAARINLVYYFIDGNCHAKTTAAVQAAHRMTVVSSNSTSNVEKHVFSLGLSGDLKDSSYKQNLSQLFNSRCPVKSLVDAVELVGEIICPPGKFGAECKINCSSCADQCDPDWGCPDACPPEIPSYKCRCPKQTYGPECQSSCKEMCGYNMCYDETGGCIPNITIRYPDNARCLFTHYGPDCENNCSRNCAGPGYCDPDDGSCIEGCLHGSDPPLCIGCPTFYYGSDCKTMCPDKCKDLGLCHFSNGTCLSGCKAGYFTPKCNKECPEGRYGFDCLKTCDNCHRNPATGNGDCNKDDGTCRSGCAEGYGGEDCKKVKVTDVFRRFLSAVPTPVLVVIALGGVVCVAQYYSPDDTGSDDDEEEEKNEGKSSHRDKDIQLPPAQLTGTPVDILDTRIKCKTYAHDDIQSNLRLAQISGTTTDAVETMIKPYTDSLDGSSTASAYSYTTYDTYTTFSSFYSGNTAYTYDTSITPSTDSSYGETVLITDAYRSMKNQIKTVPEIIKTQGKRVTENVHKQTKGVPEKIDKQTKGVPQTINKQTKGVPQTINKQTTGVPQTINEQTKGVPQTINKQTTGVPQTNNKQAKDVRETIKKQNKEGSETTNKQTIEGPKTINKQTLGASESRQFKGAHEITKKPSKDVNDGANKLEIPKPTLKWSPSTLDPVGKITRK